MSYKKWIIVAALLFTGGMLLGLMAPAGAVTDDTAGLGEIADFLGSLSPSSLFLVILINNVFSLVISFATSPVFLIMPILALTVNGWLLAAVGAEIVRVESLSFLLAGILPHGILEIPALIIAQAAAMSFGATVVTAVFKKERRNRILPSFKQNLRWLGLALFLLLPAAIIETFVTPLLLD